MGIRRYALLLLALVVVTACGEQEQAESVTGLQFANLMRTVCYQHGGCFIAQQDL